jgi:hypothetical protein
MSNRIFFAIFAPKNSATAMELSQIRIFRMTHVKNIPHILEHGITHKNSRSANSDYVAIGDVSLINTRAAKHVNITNGNRSQSLGTITLGDFIPFYFGVRMPMLYVMQHGGNYVEQITPPQDIIYVVCRVSDIVESGLTYYFSDGHATDAFTIFYDNSKIAELPAILDWKAIKSFYWGGEENLELKRKKQAEFLTANDVESKNICGFVCYNEVAKLCLSKMGIDNNKIVILPTYYF